MRIRSTISNGGWSPTWCCLALLLMVRAGWCQPRFDATGPTRMSSEVYLQEAENAALAELSRAEEFLDNRQWDDAVETVRRVMSNHGDKLIRIDSPAKGVYTHYVRVQEYCQRWLARLAKRAPAALALYRRRVDPLAGRWLSEAKAARNEALLQRLVNELLVSSWGDDALLLLGEFALERGEYGVARDCWERISPSLRLPYSEATWRRGGSGSLWLSLSHHSKIQSIWAPLKAQLTGEASNKYRRLACPDTTLSLAEVRARLVLVSIMEGDHRRAGLELAVLKRIAPEAKGTMAGKSGAFVSILSALLSESRLWPTRRRKLDWTTLGGASHRNGSFPRNIDFSLRPLWRQAISSGSARNDIIGYGRPRVAETKDNPLSIHPVIWNGIAIINEHARLRAFDLSSGKPAWPDGNRGNQPPGTFFFLNVAKERLQPPRRHVGIMRGTVTVAGDRLFAKMGSAITSPRPDDDPSQRLGVIVGLDLRAQGRLLPGFPLKPASTDWFFEGSPIVQGGHLYVAMRRQDEVRTQSYIACFSVDSGRLLWRRLIAAAQSPGLGRWPELTHGLLTYSEGALYYVTDLGAVASLRASDGTFNWLARYPRAEFQAGDPRKTPVHFFRDLSPCLVHQAVVVVAARDCGRLLAFEACSGQLLWAASPDLYQDVVHLLGIRNGQLIASGDFLYRIDLFSGRLLSQFPAGRKRAGHGVPPGRGMGRGLVTANRVFFPTREKILVFPIVSSQKPWHMIREIDLRPRKLWGGNLIVAENHLLVASSRELAAFSNQAAEEKKASDNAPRR